jgi:rfaE bifunctional protein nucleotidyltransferase chain/domain
MTSIVIDKAYESAADGGRWIELDVPSPGGRAVAAGGQHAIPAAGVIDVGSLASLRATLGRKAIVLASGCFDIVHIGHVYFLEEARRQGDVLVVGVNSDNSVCAIKGEARPVVGEDERARLLAAMRCVDHVFIYDGMVADDWIRALRPDVFVIGAESVAQYPTEAAAADEVNARVHVVERLGPHSTTSMLRKAQGRTRG